MKNYRINIFDNNRDNIVDKSNNLEWPDVCRMLFSQHHAVPDKNTVMFNAAVFEPIAGKGAIRRCAANVTAFDMVVLDYDDFQTRQDIEKRFEKYTYAAYTTFSHLVSSKKNHSPCYRVVLPLMNRIALAEFQPRLNGLNSVVGNVDPASFSISQGFYLPACLEENLDQAEIWFNDGALFDMMSIEPEIVVKRVKPLNDTPLTDSKRDSIMYELEMIAGQLHNPELMMVASGMKGSNGFSINDFHTIVNGGDSATNVKQCWNAARTYDTGVLINLIRRFGNAGFMKKRSGRSEMIQRLLKEAKAKLNNS